MSLAHNPYNFFSLSCQNFDKTTLEVFRFQAEHCEVYKQYLNLIHCQPEEINKIEAIPFLPIQLFKSHKIVSFEGKEELLFESSATTSQIPSKHYIKEEALYKEALRQSFAYAFGPIEAYCILALLPHYLDRNNSSLVYMVKTLMHDSQHPSNGFYLNNQVNLIKQIKKLEEKNQKTLLIGVSFALLDLAEIFHMPLHHVQLIETGGMKGRKQELSREVLHTKLKTAFGLPAIFSEYGMAELLSQSYYTLQQVFQPPPWKKVLVRDVYDPFASSLRGKGALNIIDLANYYSCSFIATEDIGEVNADGSFNVLGRLDQSEIRGCNLLLNT